MGLPVYIGIEQEYIVRKGNKKVDFGSICHGLYEKDSAALFRKPSTQSSVRTKAGSGMYADGKEAEICCAPTMVRKNFLPSLEATVTAGRNELYEIIRKDPALSLHGYSTHYNTSKHANDFIMDDILDAVGIPLSLLVLGRNSLGIMLRETSDEGRDELTGEYIDSLSQLRAASLFYAGAMTGLPANLPFKSDVELIDGSNYIDSTRMPNPVSEGRSAIIPIIRDGKEDEISAQEYLETYARLLQPAFEHIATKHDVENLWQHIRGVRPLLIDTQIRPADEPADLNYRVARTDTLSRFYGLLATKKRIGEFSIYDIEWNVVTFETKEDSFSVEGLHNLEVLAQLYERYPPTFKRDLRQYLSLPLDDSPILAGDVIAFARGNISAEGEENLFDNKLITADRQFTPFGRRLYSAYKDADATAWKVERVAPAPQEIYVEEPESIENEVTPSVVVQRTLPTILSRLLYSRFLRRRQAIGS